MRALEAIGVGAAAGKQVFHEPRAVLHGVGLAVRINEVDRIGGFPAQSRIGRAAGGLVALPVFIDVGAVIDKSFRIQLVPRILVPEPLSQKTVIRGVCQLMDHGIGRKIVIEIEGELHDAAGLRGEGARVRDIDVLVERRQGARQVEDNVPVIASSQRVKIAIRIQG